MTRLTAQHLFEPIGDNAARREKDGAAIRKLATLYPAHNLLGPLFDTAEWNEGSASLHPLSQLFLDGAISVHVPAGSMATGKLIDRVHIDAFLPTEGPQFTDTWARLHNSGPLAPPDGLASSHRSTDTAYTYPSW